MGVDLLERDKYTSLVTTASTQGGVRLNEYRAITPSTKVCKALSMRVVDSEGPRCNPDINRTLVPGYL